MYKQHIFVTYIGTKYYYTKHNTTRQIGNYQVKFTTPDHTVKTYE